MPANPSRLSNNPLKALYGILIFLGVGLSFTTAQLFSIAPEISLYGLLTLSTGLFLIAITQHSRLKKIQNYQITPTNNNSSATENTSQLLINLKAILQSAEAPLIAIDNQNKITIFNSAATKLTGYEAQQAIGQIPSKFLHLRNHQFKILSEQNSPFFKSFHNNKILTSNIGNHYYVTDSQGQTIPVTITASPVTNPHGEIIGAVSVMRNISIEKQLQELQNEFVFIAAHELKNPVTAITGYIEMAKEAHPRSSAVKESLSGIKQANTQLIKLINNLLQVARFEAKKLKPHMEERTLKSSLNLAQKQLRKKISERKINLKIDSPAIIKSQKILADPNFLLEILSNLLSNAIKYSPDKSTITITQELGRLQGKKPKSTNTHLITHISDKGSGIPNDEQSKIFQKFYRASNIAGTEGNGLGLFIVQQLINSMNGRIWFTSQEGKGSKFSFSLPLAKK